ncbi:MAG: hypothetical protein ACTSSI_07675, partial [Candidatus Helarchaeota archaeon]
MHGRKKIAFTIVFILLCSWAISLTPMFVQNGFMRPVSNLSDTLPDEGLTPLDNNSTPISSSSGDTQAGEPGDVEDQSNQQIASNPFYYHKNDLKKMANDSMTFLLQNLLNQTDNGFEEFVNLTGSSNSTLKLTSSNALAILALIRLYEADTSMTNYITKANNTVDFMISNLYVEDPDTGNHAFVYGVYDNLTINDKTLNISSNALAIIALCELYEITKNETILEIARETHDYIFKYLWDAEYEGYFQSNVTAAVNGSKVTYDNLLGLLASIKVCDTEDFDYEFRVNASDRIDALLDKYLSYWNTSVGFISRANRTWGEIQWNNETIVNALAITCLLDYSGIIANQSLENIACSLLDQILLLQDPINGGYNWSDTTNTKELDANSWVLMAIFKIFERENNLSVYILANNLSSSIKNIFFDITNNAFNKSESDFEKTTEGNALSILALLSIRFKNPYLTRANTTESLLIAKQWANTYFIPYSFRDFSTISTTLETESSLVSILSLVELYKRTNLSKYVYDYAVPLFEEVNSSVLNITNSIFSYRIGTLSGQAYGNSQTEDNALAMLCMIELYKYTNNTDYLDTLNHTWYFLNQTVWDSTNGGYLISDNLTDTTKQTYSNLMAILANLEIANLTSSYLDLNYPHLKSNATYMANYTFNLIIEKMWDSVNYGIFANATADWIPDNETSGAKDSSTNLYFMSALSRFNEIFPSHANFSNFDQKINETFQFFSSHLVDTILGGIYDNTNVNGTVTETRKQSGEQFQTIMTLIQLYNTSSNYTYYQLAEKTMAFINTFVWDHEYGGYFFVVEQNGSVQRSYENWKFLATQQRGVMATCLLDEVRNDLGIPPIFSIEFDTTSLDYGGKFTPVNITVIDVDGNNLSQLDVSIMLNGFERNYKSSFPSATYDFYGLGKSIQMTSLGSSNIYNGSLNISDYFGKFYIVPLLLNESYSAIWNTYTLQRLLPRYVSSAFGLLNLINYEFRSSSQDIYHPTRNDTQNVITEENLLAIQAMIKFFNASGLNLAIDWGSSSISSGYYQFDQVLFNSYINSTMSYLLTNYWQSSQSGNGFIRNGTIDSGPINETKCADNAIAIISLLNLFELTGDNSYLEAANSTWNYMNETFWDYNSSGFLTTNGSTYQDWKSLYDNAWAVMANLRVYQTTQFENLTRNRAYYMANLTINKTINDLWNTGFYSSFNSSTGTWNGKTNDVGAFNTSIHALMIQTIIKYLETNTTATAYKTWLNNTVDFLLNYLWDSEFFGFYGSCNDSYEYAARDKYLLENCLAGIALAEYYNYYGNSSIYEYCEQISLFVDTYLQGEIGLNLNNASRFGSTQDVTQSYDMKSSVFLSLFDVYMYEIRQNLDRPLDLYNFTVNAITPGTHPNQLNITIQVNDQTGTQITGARLFAVIASHQDFYKPANFTLVSGNTYRAIINVSTLLEEFTISFLALEQTGTYAAGYETFTINRTIPIYQEIAYETIKKLFSQSLYDLGSRAVFNHSFYENDLYTEDNLFLIRALIEMNETLGVILKDFNWYLNDTYDQYIEKIYAYVNNSWRTNIVLVGGRNVTGLLSGTDSVGFLSNETRVADNALAVITLLELYNATNDVEYLNLANDTWIYLNYTFWDDVNEGFTSNNDTNSNMSRNVGDNFLAILAAIEINQTSGIVANVRNNALEMAIATLDKINSSMWDVNASHYGLYYSNATIATPGDTWNVSLSNKGLLSNALASNALTRLYEVTNNQSYLNFSIQIHDLITEHFWNETILGYYPEVLANWSLPEFGNQTNRFLESNAWMAFSSLNLFKNTQNYTHYIQGEKTINFLNSYALNLYETNDIVKYVGYREKIDPNNFFYGDIYTNENSLMALLLFSAFKIANDSFWTGSSSPWLMDTTTFTSATSPAHGELINSTSSIYFSNQTSIGATFNLTATVEGWTEGSMWPAFIDEYNATFDSNGSLHIFGFINISNVEHVYIKVAGFNESVPIFWKAYYVHRMLTTVQYISLQGQTSPLGLKNNRPATSPGANIFVGYILGTDRFQINVTYGDKASSFGTPTTSISNAHVNFEVWLPNDQGLYLNRSVMTNADGIATITFGPTPKTGQYIGQYIVRITAFRCRSDTKANEFFATTQQNISLWVDYGINIYKFASLTADQVAQGDLLQLNLTLRNNRKGTSNIDIKIYGDVFITNQTLNYSLDVGTHSILYYIKVDERTTPSTYPIYVDLVFDGVTVNEAFPDESSIDITVFQAIQTTQIGAPPKIAEDDTRYAIIEVQNLRLLVDLNFTVSLYSPALEYQQDNYILSLNSKDYYFVALNVLENVAFGTYTGTIEISWVNYTISYEFSFTIQSNLVIDKICVPETPFQNQNSMITIQITNQKTEAVYVDVYITVYMAGAVFGAPIHERHYIEALETKTINIEIFISSFNSHLISQELNIEVKMDGESYFNQWYTFQPIISIENFILWYVVPMII